MLACFRGWWCDGVCSFYELGFDKLYCCESFFSCFSGDVEIIDREMKFLPQLYIDELRNLHTYRKRENEEFSFTFGRREPTSTAYPVLFPLLDRRDAHIRPAEPFDGRAGVHARADKRVLKFERLHCVDINPRDVGIIAHCVRSVA